MFSTKCTGNCEANNNLRNPHCLLPDIIAAHPTKP